LRRNLANLQKLSEGSLLAFLFWAKQPWRLIARVRYWVWEKRNPTLPWLCFGTIAYCEAHLSKTMTALEFGSGRSTLWFSRRVRHLTSIEFDRRWFEKIREQLAEAHVRNVEYLDIPLEHPRTEPERASYDPLPRYVSVLDRFADRSLDLVIVDGHYRSACIRAAAPKLAPGGYLLVDDVNRWLSLAEMGVPSEWSIVDDSCNGIKRCIIWQAS